MNWLTASRFGGVVKMLSHTSCHNLVKSILYRTPLKSDCVTFGKQFECVVIEEYKAYIKTLLTNVDFFLTKHPYLVQAVTAWW